MDSQWLKALKLKARIWHWSGSLKYQFVIFAAEVVLTIFFGISAALTVLNSHGSKMTQTMAHVIASILLSAAASTEVWYGNGWDYDEPVTITIASWLVAAACMYISMMLSILDAVVTFKTA